MKPYLQFLLVLITCLIVFSGTAAAEKTITTGSPLKITDDTCTIPVVIYNAEDISAFTIHVSNDNPNAVITINETATLAQLPDAIINSNPTSSEQIISWFSIDKPVNGDSELFWLDVERKGTTVDTVPVFVTVEDIYDSAIIDLRQKYPVRNGDATFTGMKTNGANTENKQENEAHQTADKTLTGEKTTPVQTSAADMSQPENDITPQETVFTPSQTDERKIETPAGNQPAQSNPGDAKTIVTEKTSQTKTTASPFPLSGAITALGLLGIIAYSRRT